MDDEGGPIDKVFIDLFKGFLIILIQLNLLPELVGFVCPFCCFHVEIADTFFFLDSGILRVRERTGFTVAETR